MNRRDAIVAGLAVGAAASYGKAEYPPLNEPPPEDVRWIHVSGPRNSKCSVSSDISKH